VLLVLLERAAARRFVIPGSNDEEESDHGEEVVCENCQETHASGGGEIRSAGARAKGCTRGEEHRSGQGAGRNGRSRRSSRWQISAVRSTMVEAVPAPLIDRT
jgi:hypothetical protein